MSIKIAAMTLGCPTWDLDTICTNFAAYGFDAIDFRGVGPDIDITTTAAFTTGLAATARKIADHGLAVSNISSSIALCDPAKKAANVDEARRTIEVAKGLGAGSVRMFGVGDVSLSKANMAAYGADCMAAILDLPGARSLRWGIETHDHWIKAPDCLLLVNLIGNPAVGVLWDMGHTSRVGGEDPATSYGLYKDMLVNTHVKDATYDPDHPDAMKDGWRYRRLGEGQLPLAEAIGLLRDGGYDGYITFEHEKRWHAELPEPEDCFPKAAAWLRAQLAKTA